MENQNKSELNPRELLTAKLLEIEKNRENVNAELERIAKAEAEIIARVEALVADHKRIRGRIDAGVEHQRAIEAYCDEGAERNLTPWDNIIKVSPQTAVFAFNLRAIKKVITSDFETWLAARNVEESAVFKAASDFIQANKRTIDNRTGTYNDTEFQRRLPASISEYVTK